MSKVIFVGDVHLKGSSPISRKDNYPEAVLKKLAFIKEYAEQIGSDTVIFLGDIFDTVNTSLQFFSHCLTLFKQIASSGIGLYTIVGNHDLRYDSMETLPITPLGILVKSDSVKILDLLTIDDVCITGCHYPHEPQPNANPELYSILLLHRFYESGFNETPITKKDAIALNYNALILGHDHKPYMTQEVEGVRVFRPGSLARNTSEQYNRLRKPRILVMDTTSKSFAYEEVPAPPGEEVFFEREEENKEEVSMGDLVEYLKSSYNAGNVSVRDYLSQARMPEETRSLIAAYLDILGA